MIKTLTSFYLSNLCYRLPILLLILSLSGQLSGESKDNTNLMHHGIATKSKKSCPHTKKQSICIWEGSTAGSYPHPPFVSPDVTVRQLLRASVTADSLRIRLNRYLSTEQLHILEAWVVLPTADVV